MVTGLPCRKVGKPRKYHVPDQPSVAAEVSLAECKWPLLRLLMGSWTTYILWHLRQDGPLRFGALRRAIPGISSKILTQRLRMLEEHGIVYRHHVP